MSKITKWAVETAKDAMNTAINKKLAGFDKKNPKKAVSLSVADMAKIAVKDPEWQRVVVERAMRGCYAIDIRSHNFENDSPMVAAAVKKSNAVDAKRDEAREKLNDELCESRDSILNSAIIGDYDSDNLLVAVKEFCK